MTRMDMEDELKNVLRRREAPEGFADRVMVRVAAQPPTQPKRAWMSLFAQPLVRWAAFATVSAAMILGVYGHNVQRQRAEGEAAKQRLILALRIAGSKLQLAKSKVNQINANPNHSAENQEEKE